MTGAMQKPSGFLALHIAISQDPGTAARSEALRCQGSHVTQTGQGANNPCARATVQVVGLARGEVARPRTELGQIGLEVADQPLCS